MESYSGCIIALFYFVYFASAQQKTVETIVRAGKGRFDKSTKSVYRSKRLPLQVLSYFRFESVLEKLL